MITNTRKAARLFRRHRHNMRTAALRVVSRLIFHGSSLEALLVLVRGRGRRGRGLLAPFSPGRFSPGTARRSLAGRGLLGFSSSQFWKVCVFCVLLRPVCVRLRWCPGYSAKEGGSARSGHYTAQDDSKTTSVYWMGATFLSECRRLCQHRETLTASGASARDGSKHHRVPASPRQHWLRSRLTTRGDSCDLYARSARGTRCGKHRSYCGTVP